MKTKRPKKTYSLRMDPITWNGIVKMATENNLSISDQVEMILKWALKRWTFTQPEGNNPIKRLSKETEKNNFYYDPEIAETIRLAKEKWDNEN